MPEVVTREAPPEKVLPEQIRRQQAALEAFVQQQEPQPESPQVEPEPPAAETASEPVPEAPQPPAEAVAQPEPVPTPQTHLDAPVPTKAEMAADDWASKYNAMRGRWEKSEQTVASMRDQMAQMGSELQYLHEQMQRGALPQPQQPQPQPQHFITAEDEATFGKDLIDLAARTAQQVISPKLSALEQENRLLTEQVRRQANTTITGHLDATIPNWREVKNNQRFNSWLNLPDLHSGMVRRQLMNDAVQRANAPRIASFYRSFLADEAATGHVTSEAPSPQPPAPVRQAAIPLASLAAPGRSRPAPGSVPQLEQKPIITGDDLKAHARRVTSGYYTGRPQELAKVEAEVAAAMRDGRLVSTQRG